MTREELDTLWHKALIASVRDGELYTRYRFAALVAKAEREVMLQDGWRQCAVGQRTTQFCAMTEEAVKAEREACAKVCEKIMHNLDHASKEWSHADLWDVAEVCAGTIRARGKP